MRTIKLKDRQPISAQTIGEFESEINRLTKENRRLRKELGKERTLIRDARTELQSIKDEHFNNTKTDQYGK